MHFSNLLMGMNYHSVRSHNNCLDFLKYTLTLIFFNAQNAQLRATNDHFQTFHVFLVTCHKYQCSWSSITKSVATKHILPGGTFIQYCSGRKKNKIIINVFEQAGNGVGFRLRKRKSTSNCFSLDFGRKRPAH